MKLNLCLAFSETSLTQNANRLCGAGLVDIFCVLSLTMRFSHFEIQKIIAIKLNASSSGRIVNEKNLKTYCSACLHSGCSAA